MNRAFASITTCTLSLWVGGLGAGCLTDSDPEHDGGETPIVIECRGYEDCNSRGACVLVLDPVTFDQCPAGEVPRRSTRCIARPCGAQCIVGPMATHPEAPPGIILTYAIGECGFRDAAADAASSLDASNSADAFTSADAEGGED